MSKDLTLDPDILESYVLGLTNAEDTARIEKLKAESPEVLREIQELQATLELLSSAHARNPRPHLKAAIWSSVQQAGADLQQSTRTQAQPRTTPSGSATASTSGSRSALLGFPFLSVLGISILAIGTSLYFMLRTSELQKSLVQTQLSIEQYKQRSNADEQRLRAIEQELHFRNSSSTHAIPLFGINDSKYIVARIYVNPQDTMRYITMTDAIDRNTGKLMVLWAQKEQRFVAVGEYTSATPGSMMKLQSTPASTEFALSMEESPRAQSLQASRLLAQSSASVLRTLQASTQRKKDPFIAGEPFRSMKRAAKH